MQCGYWMDKLDHPIKIMLRFCKVEIKTVLYLFFKYIPNFMDLQQPNYIETLPQNYSTPSNAFCI